MKIPLRGLGGSESSNFREKCFSTRYILQENLVCFSRAGADAGYVPDVKYLIISIFEEADYRVESDVGSRVAQVRYVLNRWSADVNFDQIGLKGLENFEFSSKGVKYFNWHSAIPAAYSDINPTPT